MSIGPGGYVATLRSTFTVVKTLPDLRASLSAPRSPLAVWLAEGPACAVSMRAREPGGVEFHGEGAARPKVSLWRTMNGPRRR
jgi:hypothetical protein